MFQPARLKLMAVVVITITTFLLLPLFAVVYSLFSIKTVEEEMLRVASPSGALEATVRRINYSALSPYEYRVFITRAGRSIARRDMPLLVAEKVGFLRLNWAEEYVLQVTVDKARIKRFTNQYYSAEVHNVELQLVPAKPYLLDREDREGGGYGTPKLP